MSAKAIRGDSKFLIRAIQGMIMPIFTGGFTLDAVDTCAVYDDLCHVQKMTIPATMVDQADSVCSELHHIYNKLNGSSQFVRAGLTLNTLTDLCEVNEGVLELTIKSNYYSPLGDKAKVMRTCELISEQKKIALTRYFEALGVNPMSCSSLTSSQQTILQLDSSYKSDCDFSCEVIKQLANPDLNTAHGQFAAKFNTFKAEPDMLAKIAVYYEKQYNQKIDLVAIRNASEKLEPATKPTTDALNGTVISLHRGVMASEKFSWIIAGAKYAQSIASTRSELIIDDAPSKVITYAKSNQQNMPTIALGGFPLLLNKQHGLSQMHSLFSSIALSITQDFGRSGTHFIISNNNPISQQLNYHIKDANFITVNKMDTEAALEIVRKIAEASTSVDEKGQPIFVGKITVLGDHIFSGFLSGTVKVKTSAKSEITWTTMTTDVKKYSASELRDMPGYKSIVPETVKSVYSAFADKFGDNGTIMAFAHFLIGYQAFILFSEGENNTNCETSDHAKRTGSGDFVTCL